MPKAAPSQKMPEKEHLIKFGGKIVNTQNGENKTQDIYTVDSQCLSDNGEQT